MKAFSNSLIIFSLLLTSACNNSTNDADPKAKLEVLKKQAQEIDVQIKEIEAKIAASDTTAPVAKSKLVKVDSLRSRDFKHFIELQGTVSADQNVLAAPQMPGVVTAIFVKEGDFVSPGKILATLDGTTIKKGMDELKTGLNLANTMFEKQKKLWDQNIGSEAQYLQAKNQKEQLESKMQTLQSQLAMTYIKSPISGTVDDVHLKIGEIANPGFAGIRVVNNKNMKVLAKISDNYQGKLKKGDKVMIHIPESDKSIESTIRFISKTIDPKTRSFIIESSLPSGSSDFISNQSVKLKINNGTLKSAIIVSSNLVQKSIQGENYILVAESTNGSLFAKKRTVETGVEYNGETQIIKGLQIGDLIITIGYNELVDGQLISL
ncbi:MAG: efflux RND transporter periplasmic adaptor subunit [Saprospiraceae bacterium]|nr:efflux RND transporter periplasmic adaptor subunit [Saprospiraceae bacterium]